MSVETTIALFVMGLVLIFLGYLIGSKISVHKANAQWEEKLPGIRQDAISRSRANLGGKFSENLCAYFPDFPFHPTEMRWLGGSPTDYIVFNGMDNDKIEGITFLEIKSGKSQLSLREKQIKEIVENKKVFWHLYRVPETVTKVD